MLEKLFGSVFWDYSEKPLNLQGRICLQYSISWGFLGLLLIDVLDPTTVRLVQARPVPAAARTELPGPRRGHRRHRRLTGDQPPGNSRVTSGPCY